MHRKMFLTYWFLNFAHRNPTSGYYSLSFGCLKFHRRYSSLKYCSGYCAGKDTSREKLSK